MKGDFTRRKFPEKDFVVLFGDSERKQCTYADIPMYALRGWFTSNAYKYKMCVLHSFQFFLKSAISERACTYVVLIFRGESRIDIRFWLSKSDICFGRFPRHF